MVWIRKDDNPGIMPWNLRYEPVSKRVIPEAITDLGLNLKNRQYAIDDYLYGPMNPDKPGDYWHRLADVWEVSVEEAASTRCGNCAAFNQKPDILSAIADGISDEGDAVTDAAGLGYCELFEFKCAAARSCSAWLTGGPLTKSVDIERDEMLKGKGYDPNQPRAEDGKWTAGGAGASSSDLPSDPSQLSTERGSGVGGVISGQTAGSVLQQMLADGGISITFTGEKPKSGFMVAVEGTEVVVDDATMRSEEGKAIVREHIKKHAAYIREGRGTTGRSVSFMDQPKNYFGAWFNEQTAQNPDGDNKWYLDISENIGTLSDAVRVGRERSQLAIWDVRGEQGISMDSQFADYAMTREGGNPDGESWNSLRNRWSRRHSTPSDALKAAKERP